MKRVYTCLLAFCSLAALFATSCKKSGSSNYGVVSVNTDESRLNQLFAGLRTAPQNISVTAGASQTVYCLNGTKLTFYPNSFMDKEGNTLVKGIVNLQVTEIYTPGDMIANRVATTSGGKLLTSGGQVQIAATMNGEEVFANKYGIGFRQHTAKQQPMSLFYGGAGSDDSVVVWGAPVASQTGTFVNGTITTSDTNLVVVVTSSGTYTITTHSALMTYYQFDSCASFRWINCDYFHDSLAELTDMRVMMPDTSFNQSNTEVFIVFPTINAAAHMTKYDAATHTFHLAQGAYIPVGMHVDIVVATNKNGSYYYFGENSVTTESRMFLYAQMSLVSLAYIRSQLDNL